MTTEYMKYENKENNWTLHEIREFSDNGDTMENASLIVVDSTTGEMVSDNRLEDDVWQFPWEAASKLEYFPGETIETVTELKQIKK